MKICPACSATIAPDDDWRCSKCENVPQSHDGIPLLAPDIADGFNPEDFRILAAIEDDSFWFKARKALMVDLLQKHARHARSLLEIGCGTGYMLKAISHQIPTLQVTGGELHPEGLQYARKRLPEVPLVQMDARKLPFSREFDVICAFDVLEHIDEDEEAMQSIRSALRPGGVLLMSVPQHRFLWSSFDEYAHHQRRYSRPELQSKLKRAGFEIQLITSFVTLLMPLMFASRMRERFSSKEFDPGAEHTSLPTPLSRVFEGILNAERMAIRKGVSLPMGGTLVALAQPTPS